MGCAISATLVQQWARSYLHAVDNQHHPPHKRALIRAYMFEGMGESHMTVAIEGIPILLHASLFLFLIGLIVYFYGINPLIAYPIMAVFVVSVTMYLIPTCMPLVRSNFPFHTPLSSPFWWLWRVTRHREPLRSAKTMEMIRECDATHNKRNGRGYDAISWILSQSDEDREFEQFLDAIAGFKGGKDPLGGRVMVTRLVKQYPAEILLRTYTMLRSCGRFPKKLDNRTTVILRAIPALALSWSTIDWKETHVVHLSQWPLKMLEILDKEAVTGNKACLDSDLVVSTYYILLHITTCDPNTHVEAKYLEPEILNIDHDTDNIKAAKELVLGKQAHRKSTDARPSDIIIDALVAGAFRRALSQVIQTPHYTAPLMPYIIMLRPLSAEGDPQHRFSICVQKLLLDSLFSQESPELRDRFLRTAALMDDAVAINTALPAIEHYLGIYPGDTIAQRTKTILGETLSALQLEAPATRPPSHKERPHRPPLKATDHAYDLGNLSTSHFPDYSEASNNVQGESSAELRFSTTPPPGYRGVSYNADPGIITGGSRLSGETLAPSNNLGYFPFQPSKTIQVTDNVPIADVNEDKLGNDYRNSGYGSMTTTSTTTLTVTGAA